MINVIGGLQQLGYSVDYNQEFQGYEIAEGGIVVQWCPTVADVEDFLRRERDKIFNPKPYKK